MSELVTKSVAPEEQEQKIETHTGVERIARFTIVATAVAVLAVLGAAVLLAQGQDNDKYSLKSPSGITLRAIAATAANAATAIDAASAACASALSRPRVNAASAPGIVESPAI